MFKSFLLVPSLKGKRSNPLYRPPCLSRSPDLRIQHIRILETKVRSPKKHVFEKLLTLSVNSKNKNRYEQTPGNGLRSRNNFEGNAKHNFFFPRLGFPSKRKLTSPKDNSTDLEPIHNLAVLNGHTHNVITDDFFVNSFE